MSSRNNPARVAIVMGSKSDWATMQFAAKSDWATMQFAAGIPVGTLAIGKAGAANAALLAAQILAQHDAELHQRIADWRKAQTDEVLENPDPRGTL
ncbi:Phosphoribosylaminoimidazole carboxylase catalytic subunit [Salmonella enterica subsp. enterica serovar Give str. S5-487]|nr:Phosphoribosylaminoimidazole carboxylase catalytic subunit [Salmonella enterica subsp. enterica serovar Give str. S5-487]